MWIIADSWFRIDDRSVVMNKLRRLFNPTPEERAEDNARMKKVFEESAKKRGCSTCMHCVDDENLPYYPNFVTVERCKCLIGLKCDTVMFTISNCPQYIKKEIDWDAD